MAQTILVVDDHANVRTLIREYLGELGYRVLTARDGVEALLKLASAPADRLTRTAYNVRAFNPSAEEVRDMVLRAFPQAIITWDTDTKRQSIVDSWPADVDDSAARADWGFAPRYDFEAAFREYLIPGIRERYAATS